MAYNTSKGDRQLGDIKNEDDPDTQIDFGTDQIALATGGTARLTVTNVAVTSAVALTASAYAGDGSALQGITGSITTYTNATDNYVLTSAGAGSINGESGLTFDGSTLVVQSTASPIIQVDNTSNDAYGAVINLNNQRGGNAGAADDFCGGVTFLGKDSTSADTQYGKITTKISSPTNTSEAGYMLFEVTTAGTAATTYLRLDGGTNAITSSVTTRMESDLILDATLDIGPGIDSDAKIHVSGSDNSTLAIFESPSNPLIMAITGSGQVVVGGVYLDAKLNITGSDTDKLISAKSDSADPAFYVSGSGDAYISGSLRAKQLYYTTHKFTPGSDGLVYLRFDTVGIDTAPTNNNKMVAPHNGKLNKVVWRFEGTGTGGSTTTAFSLHKGVTNQQQIQVTPVATVNLVDNFIDDTTYTATFLDTAVFASGDIVGVSVDPAFDPGITVVTCVWEFDQNN